MKTRQPILPLPGDEQPGDDLGVEQHGGEHGVQHGWEHGDHGNQHGEWGQRQNGQRRDLHEQYVQQYE